MPAVLVLSGLDPSGGAGINADIETLSAHKVASLPIITVLTAQNTQKIGRIQAVDMALITEQIDLLRQDIKIDAIKVGLLADDKQINQLTQILANFSNIPIVLDPIIYASTTDRLLTKNSISVLKNLLPLCTCITPNVAELNALSGLLDNKDGGKNSSKNEQQQVVQLPVPWVLVTKTDVSDIKINHQLYFQGKPYQTYSYDKLPHQYHGSGCTLSSAITAQIALGQPIPSAIHLALDYSYESLKSAYKLGKMQHQPNRFVSIT